MQNYNDMQGYLQGPGNPSKDLVRFHYADKEDVFDKDVIVTEDLDNDSGTPELIEGGVSITQNSCLLPNPNDAGWTDYLISQLRANELQDGHPTNFGLRRLVETFIGQIAVIDTDVIEAPKESNHNRATVKVKIEILCQNGDYLTFSGVADSYDGNTDVVYRKYPTAIAETRAESRAFRKALRIQTVSADELSKVASEDSREERESYITDSQINVFNIVGQRTKREDSSGQGWYQAAQFGWQSGQVKKLKHGEAADLIKKISEYQQDTSKITKELEGYEANWSKA